MGATAGQSGMMSNDEGSTARWLCLEIMDKHLFRRRMFSVHTFCVDPFSPEKPASFRFGLAAHEELYRGNN